MYVTSLVLEAMGRPPMGLYEGNVYDLGQYDDCLAITHDINGEVMHTKYCYAGLAIPLVNISFTEAANVKTKFVVSNNNIY